MSSNVNFRLIWRQVKRNLLNIKKYYNLSKKETSIE